MGAVTTTLEGGRKKFSGQRLSRCDFSGQDLQNADFRGAVLTEANFTGADLSFANFEGANCWGACFKDANLRRTNFRDAVLANVDLRARNCFGITLTLSCDSVDETKVSSGLWYAWLMFATMMEPDDEDAKNQLIALIGPERFVKYKAHFRNREL